jgi:hypothetical protein
MLAHMWMTLKDVAAGLHRGLHPWSGVVQRMRRGKGAAAVVVLATVASVPLAATPPDSPLVTMAVTLPSGEVKTLAAHDSETVTFKVADGTEFGVRPTIIDSKPWTRTNVTFFRMPTTSATTAEVGTAEARTGAAAVSVKGTPAFKVAVSTIAMDAVAPNTSSRQRTTLPSASE